MESLEKQGRVAEAQKIILDALNESYGGAAVAARNTFGGALDALHVTLGNLLTGGEGTLDGARKAVEDLNKQLQDPQTKESVDALMQSLVTLSSWATTALAEAIQFSRFLGEMVAKAIHGSADPLERLDADIDKVRARIKTLRDDLERPVFFRINPFGEGKARAELAELEKKVASLQGARDSLARMVAAPPPAPPPAAPVPPVPPRAQGAPAASSYIALTDAAKTYADVMKRLAAVQQDAALAGTDLTATQRALVESMSSAEFRAWPDAWKAVFVAQAESALEMEHVAQQQQRLNALIEATPTAKLEQQCDTMLLLAGAFEDGRISAEQFSEAAATALGNVGKGVEDTSGAFLDINRLGEDAAGRLSSAFGDFFSGQKTDVGDMLKDWASAVAKMVMQATMLRAVQGVLSKFGLGGGSAASTGATPFAKGGAFTNSIVDRPTPFLFARGNAFGVMGEAGPEAVMPLRRGADGNLGVMVAGVAGGTGGPVPVTIVNQTSTPVESSAKMTMDGNGMRQLEITIYEKVKGRMIRDTQQGGGLAPILENKYGLNPAAGARV